MNEKRDERQAVSAPRFVRRGRMVLAGLRERFTEETMSEIPKLWARFAPLIGQVPGEVEGVAYGVCVRPGCEGEAGFEYMAAVEVVDGVRTEELDGLEIPALEYAVFAHEGHVSKLVNTLEGIHREWAPRLQRALAEGDRVPAFLERYGPGFDPMRGEGDMEIWVPVGR